MADETGPTNVTPSKDGDRSDVPNTPEERAELIHKYLKELAENPNEHLGLLGEDTEKHRRYADRARFAARVINSGILWDPRESEFGELAFGSWAELREVVEGE